MEIQFRAYCSLIIYFIPDTTDLFVLCAFILNFSFIRKKGTVGILTGIAELFSRWSVLEYSLLCPVSHGKLCARVTAAVKDLSEFPLWTLFIWFATCLSVSLRVGIWPENCNFGKSIFLVTKLLMCFELHWKQRLLLLTYRVEALLEWSI